MTDKTDFVQAVETELQVSGTVSERTCNDFDRLPVDAQIALARALAFGGCASMSVPPAAEGTVVPEEDRVRAARLMLLKLAVHTGSPRYSSYVLEKMLKAVMETPEGSIGDVFRALFDLLREHRVELTRPLATFLTDLTIRAFTAYRGSYEAADFEWMAKTVNAGPTPAQAYLAMHSLPAALVPGCRAALLGALAPTEFAEEASQNLEEDGAD